MHICLCPLCAEIHRIDIVLIGERTCYDFIRDQQNFQGGEPLLVCVMPWKMGEEKNRKKIMLIVSITYFITSIPCSFAVLAGNPGYLAQSQTSVNFFVQVD